MHRFEGTVVPPGCKLHGSFMVVGVMDMFFFPFQLFCKHLTKKLGTY